MSTSVSPLRLTPPAHQMYETSAGEQTVLRNITPENIGGLYGLLVGQRGDAERRARIYGEQLSDTNRRQHQIAGQQLSIEDLKNIRETSLGMSKQGVDHTALPALMQLVNPQAVGQVAQTDNQRRQAINAESVANLGRGAQSLGEIGVIPIAGQTVGLDAASLSNLRSTSTGVPTDLRVANANASGGDGGERISVGSLMGSSASPTIDIRARSPQRVLELRNQLLPGLTAQIQQQLGVGGGNTGGTTGGATGGTPAPVVSIPDINTARARAVAQGIPSNARIMHQDIPGGAQRWIAVVPGSAQPVVIK